MTSWPAAAPSWPATPPPSVPDRRRGAVAGLDGRVTDAVRTTCPQCRRPTQVCVCAAIRPVPSRTRVAFLQHPREARMPVSTCRLAHLSLPNSELHIGMRAEGSARLEALARAPGTMVLFPGPGSTDVTELTAPPTTLLVVDGTWINARKLVQRSPLLAALPRLGFVPAAPSTYRIRKEPAAHCLSTIEAVAHVLEALEAAPGQFTPMLASFDRMVEQQLAYIADAGARNHTRPDRHAKGPGPVQRLRDLGDRLVLLFADAHAPPHSDGAEQLLQWAAVRPTTGARFDSLLRLPHPVSAHVSWGVPGMANQPVEAAEDAVTRWRSFAPTDVTTVATWGRFSLDVLATLGVDTDPAIDLKHLVSNALHEPLGGVEHLAERLGATLPDGQGRAVRKLAALEAVIAALVEGRLGGGV